MKRTHQPERRFDGKFTLHRANTYGRFRCRSCRTSIHSSCLYVKKFNKTNTLFRLISCGYTRYKVYHADCFVSKHLTSDVTIDMLDVIFDNWTSHHLYGRDRLEFINLLCDMYSNLNCE